MAIRNAAVGNNSIDVCIGSRYTRRCVLRERFSDIGGGSVGRLQSSASTCGMKT
jgi:hypothetical protein